MNGTRSPPTNSRIVDHHIKCVLLFLSANKKSQIRNFRRNRKTTSTYFSVINPVRCTKKKHLQEVLNPPWANFYFHFLQHFDHHFPLEIFYLHAISHWTRDASMQWKRCILWLGMHICSEKDASFDIESSSNSTTWMMARQCWKTNTWMIFTTHSLISTTRSTRSPQTRSNPSSSPTTAANTNDNECRKNMEADIKCHMMDILRSSAFHLDQRNMCWMR